MANDLATPLWSWLKKKFLRIAPEGRYEFSSAIYGWVIGTPPVLSPGGTDEWILEPSFVPLGLKLFYVTRNHSDKSPGYVHTVPTGRTADPAKQMVVDAIRCMGSGTL